MKTQLTIFLLSLVVFKHISGCPGTCSCDNDSKGTNVDCYYRSLGYFPADFPSNTYRINVYYNNIETVGVRICNLYPSLEYLNLGGNMITYISAEIFAGCGNLLTLDLHYNSIQEIHDDAFASLRTLRELILYGTSLTTLSASAFRSMINLEYLALNQNSISEIHVDAFVNLSSLETLLLNSNRLTSVSASTFRNMHNLRELNLGFNSIRVIKGGMWENKNLTHMWLGGGASLLCNCDIIPFYEWIIQTSASVEGARCTSGTDVKDITQENLSVCTFCECYNSGSCLITDEISTLCLRVRNFTEDTCQGKYYA